MLASQHGLIPDEDCNSNDAQAWSCNGTTPTFWGCCKDNPCALGSCPAGALAGAKLKTGNEAMPYLQAYNSSFVDGGNEVSSSSVSAATQTSSPSSTPATTTPTAAPQSSSSSTNIGAIAGGAVGGFAVLALLIFGIIFLFRRRRSHKGTHSSSPHHNITDQDPNATSPAPYQSYTQTQPQGGEMKQAQGEANTTQYDAHNHLLTKNTGGFSPASPYPGSPQPASSYPNSPGPPSYWEEQQRAKHFSHELSGSMGGQELESGQMYHPYRSGGGLGSPRG